MSTEPVYFAHTEHPADPQTHEPVVDHAVAVSNHCIANTPSDTTLSDGTSTQPVLYVMAWCHDLGKLTTWWQEDHNNTTVPSVDRPAGRVGNHSFFGGVVTWWTLRELGYPASTILPAVIAVARHHSTLPNLEDYTINRFVDRPQWETVRHQIQNIDSHQQSREIVSQVFDHLLKTEELYADQSDQSQQNADKRSTTSDWQAFVETVQSTGDSGSESGSKRLRASIKSSITGLTGVSLEQAYKSKAVYHDSLELYGGLKGADTPASAGLSPANQSLPEPDVIDDYVQSELSPPTNPQTEVERLNAKREEIRQNTLTRVDRILGHNATTATTTAKSTAGSESQTPSATEGGTHYSGENYSPGALTGGETQPTPPIQTDIPAGVYTLTLPTGAGKTITGTQAALKFHEAQVSDGPLIHILPYTSIIEQTESVYQTLFEEHGVTTGVDHYLADNAPEGETDTDDSTDSDDLIETAYQSWHTDITLSTTVQLWESLYGPSKSQATKLPQFYNSTIIIDEPQTTPPTWWNRVEQLVDTLNSVFNATVILMSATHPPLQYPTPNVGPDGEAELAPSVSLPDNVTVTLDASIPTDTPLSPDPAATHLRDEIVDGRDSILSIHNTISNARAVTESLISRLHTDTEVSVENIHTIYTDLITDGDDTESESPADVEYDRETIYDQLPSTEVLVDALIECEADVLLVPLTTRNRPCDRSRILDALSALLDRYPRSTADVESLPTVVALTTQLIEAGVDISFESLYRDIAPYDSLVQAAGRCNRNYEYGVGNGSVTLWRLNARQGANTSQIPAEYVYNQTGINELHRTVQTLESTMSDDRRISQSDFLSGYTDYREGIIPQIPDQTQQMDTVSGAAMTAESLIDDDRPEITVYVSQSPAEDRLLKSYCRADRTNNIPEQIAIRECLRHIACDVPRNRKENPITDCAHQLGDGLYFLGSAMAASSGLYGWKGLSNDKSESDTVSHCFL
ncbi:hypothetical protein EKH57_17365 (plasmid) [Halorubrum sp. BOL3-1]|uniref:DEAD/DEAH box helicase family protein n=1 Tax=Halorubrum sp. BOL3-1 TaxID=2497325 RepID=UPI0010051C46|nr:DEAD/DEAH box helicase family protein [Halorubrum sp. BOL3-1]QAU14455.1 hypothetical protein EKH57_17365 [Halorubrum sp. BOL3-1]